MTQSTDRIERQIFLKAPPSKVWHALSNAPSFGDWFGVALKGKTFEPGKRVRGYITHPGCEHLVWEVLIVEMATERLLSFRWHPNAVDPAMDYSTEPATLVEFKLEPVEGGTLLRLVESGFDKVPVARRSEAFRMNGNGWDIQMKNIEKYVAAQPHAAS